MKHLFISLCASVILLSYSCKEENTNKIEMITVEEMQELSQDESIQLIDVRTPQEYEEGYIANFQNIDYLSPDFEKQLAKLDKSKPVIVYCESGGRSAKCALKMKEKGFVKIYDLKGGIAKWKYKGFKVKLNP